jgi:hypothetical protein
MLIETLRLIITICWNRMLNIDWLLRFYVPLKKFSFIWRLHHCWWRAAKFRPMFGAQGLWAGRDLYRATPAVTQGLDFSSLTRRLLRCTRGCGGSILTRILTGPLSVAVADPGILKRWPLQKGGRPIPRNSKIFMYFWSQTLSFTNSRLC